MLVKQEVTIGGGQTISVSFGTFRLLSKSDRGEAMRSEGSFLIGLSFTLRSDPCEYTEERCDGKPMERWSDGNPWENGKELKPQHRGEAARYIRISRKCPCCPWLCLAKQSLFKTWMLSANRTGMTFTISYCEVTDQRSALNSEQTIHSQSKYSIDVDR